MWTTVLVKSRFTAVFDAYTGTYNDLCNIIFYFRKLQAPRSALVCGTACGMYAFAGFVDKVFGHFRPEIRYGALPRGSRNLYKMLPIYSSSIWYKAVERPSTIWRNHRQQNHSPVYCSESGPRPRHSSPKCGWRHQNDFIVMGNVHWMAHDVTETIVNPHTREKLRQRKPTDN